MVKNRYWIQENDTGYKILDKKSRIQNRGSRIQNQASRIQYQISKKYETKF